MISKDLYRRRSMGDNSIFMMRLDTMPLGKLPGKRRVDKLTYYSTWNETHWFRPIMHSRGFDRSGRTGHPFGGYRHAYSVMIILKEAISGPISYFTSVSGH